MSRMTMRCLGFIIMASAARAASRWEATGYGGGNKTEAHQCGGVTGEVGAYVPWSGSSGDDYLFSHANLGHIWTGTEPMQGTAAPKTVADEHKHFWAKVGGGVPQKNTLHVQSWQTWDEGGTASILNTLDPQWWWTTTLTYALAAPKAQTQAAGFSNWVTVTWTKVHQNTAPTYAPGKLIKDLPGPPIVANGMQEPAATGTMGGYRASLNIPQMAATSKLRVVVPWSVTSGADCDNAQVSQYREGIHYDAVSKMTADDPTEDFDYTGDPF